MTPWEKCQVLIAGGLRFVGEYLARRLIAPVAGVILADSLIPECGGSLHNIRGLEDHAKINISDVRDTHSGKYLI